MKTEKYNMDRRISIQNYTTTRSDSGAEVETWADWRTVWAQVDYPNTGNSEEVMTDQQMITRRAKFTIRFTGTVAEKWRIIYLGDVFDIIRIVPVGGRQQYEEITGELRK